MKEHSVSTSERGTSTTDTSSRAEDDFLYNLDMDREPNPVSELGGGGGADSMEDDECDHDPRFSPSSDYNDSDITPPFEINFPEPMPSVLQARAQTTIVLKFFPRALRGGWVYRCSIDSLQASKELIQSIAECFDENRSLLYWLEENGTVVIDVKEDGKWEIRYSEGIGIEDISAVIAYGVFGQNLLDTSFSDM